MCQCPGRCLSPSGLWIPQNLQEKVQPTCGGARNLDPDDDITFTTTTRQFRVMFTTRWHTRRLLFSVGCAGEKDAKSSRVSCAAPPCVLRACRSSGTGLALSRLHTW